MAGEATAKKRGPERVGPGSMGAAGSECTSLDRLLTSCHPPSGHARPPAPGVPARFFSFSASLEALAARSTSFACA